jgi:hypothetical protein
MNKIRCRFAVWVASLIVLVVGPTAVLTIADPAVSWACDGGLVWDPGANACVAPGPPPPPPPPPVPVTMCIGAPVPFVPMGWCFPVGGG